MALELGKTYKLQSLKGDPTIVERLQELGFIPGEDVQVLHRAPFGDPFVVKVRDISVALRKRELECLVLKF